MKRLLATGLVVLSGCSVVFDLSEYDSGTGSGAGTGVTSSTGSMSTTASSTTGGPVCGTGVPPASDVQETFDDAAGMLFLSGTCASLEAGQAVFRPSSNGDYCGAVFPGVRSLAGASFTVRVNEATTQTLGVQTYVYLDDTCANERGQLILESGGFQIGKGNDPSFHVEFSNDSYNPATDLYWRIGGDDQGNISFDTSADGVNWDNRAFGPSPMGLESVEISIGAGMWDGEGGGDPDPGQARIDCINVVPCP